MTRLFALALMVVTGGAAVARADVRLDYAPPPELSCPDASVLRDAVAIRLGYDPFVADAPRTVALTVARDAEGIRAEVRIIEADGSLGGRREIVDVGPCAELVDTLVLAVSIAIDPARAMGAPAPEPEPVSEPEPVAATPDSTGSPTAQPTTTPDIRTLQFRLGIAGHAGLSPGVTGAIRLEVRLRWGLFSIGLDGVLPEIPTASAGASAWRAGIGVVPCVHLDWDAQGGFAGCAIVDVGAIVGEGPRQASAPFVTLGARAEVTFVLERVLLLGAHADLLVTPTPTDARIFETIVWGTGYVGGALGVWIGAVVDLSGSTR